MAIHTCWDNPDLTALRLEMLPGWTWDELATVLTDALTTWHVNVIVHLVDEQPLTPARISVPPAVTTEAVYIVIANPREALKPLHLFLTALFPAQTQNIFCARTITEARLLLRHKNHGLIAQ